jgi:hypothetical protein
MAVLLKALPDQARAGALCTTDFGNNTWQIHGLSTNCPKGGMRAHGGERTTGDRPRYAGTT